MAWQEIDFHGKAAWELKAGTYRMVVVSGMGPRIGFWGRTDRENLLFRDTEGRARNEWQLAGGHRVWPIRPEADESEDAYRPDNDPCEVARAGEELVVTAPTDPVLQTRRGIRVRRLGDDRVSVTSFISNVGDMLYSAGVWALTCTQPAEGRTYGIPLGDGSDWDCFRYTIFKRWGGHTARVNDPQINLTEKMLIVTPEGVETKRMIEAPQGITAMNAPDQETTFVKKAAYDRTARYPLGCNLAFYIGPDNFMVEMESMGPERTLKPGETISLEEIWVLTDSAVGLENAERLVGLFD